MRIQDIKIGERFRKDMGDIAGLARSIKETGLLHPIVVLSDGTLVVGARRIAAFEMLGRSDIPATVLNVESILRGQCDENVQR